MAAFYACDMTERFPADQVRVDAEHTPLETPDVRELLQAGRRVRITQQIPRQSGSQKIVVEGVILKAEQQKSGSWFAHTKDHKVWVDRVQLEKDDGELVYVNLDNYSVVEAG